jgi:tetratricopeptide (TPR) repeat protein
MLHSGSAARITLAALLLSVAATPQALAQRSDTAGSNTEKVEALSAQGTSAFRAGDYAAANRHFRAAYALHPDPTLLYNIARCHQALGEVDKAIATYRLFLRNRGIDETLRGKAQSRLDALVEVQKRAQQERAEQPDPSAKASAAEPAAPPTAPTAARPPRTSSPWGWVVLGSGIALAAGGATLMAMGYSDHSEVDDAPTNGAGIKQLTQREADELASSGKTKKMAGTALLAVGGAALAGGAVMLLLGSSTESESNATEQPTRVDVGFLPGGFITSLQGSF